MRLVARVLAVCAISAVGGAAFACGLVLPAGVVSPALADDPPSTTAPTTTTQPAPVPDPAPPTPKPAQAQHSRPAPTYRVPSSTPSVTVQKATSAPTHSTPRTKKAKARRNVQAKHKVVPTKSNVTRSVTPTGLEGARGTASKSGTVFLLVVASLVAAIVCFGTASIPATLIPRRTSGDFVLRHKVDMTVLGIGLFLAALSALFWSSRF